MALCPTGHVDFLKIVIASAKTRDKVLSMVTRFPGTCNGCSAHVPAGAQVTFRRGEGILECPACIQARLNESMAQMFRAQSIKALAAHLEAARLGVWDHLALEREISMAPRDVAHRAKLAMARTMKEQTSAQDRAEVFA